mgnify:CR=1 FL=1
MEERGERGEEDKKHGEWMEGEERSAIDGCVRAREGDG